MTLDEAKKVALMIGHADGGCGTCVSQLTKLAASLFPEFEWRYAGGEMEAADILEPFDWDGEPQTKSIGRVDVTPTP